MEAPHASTVWGLEKRIPPKLTRESGVHVHPLAILRADVELINRNKLNSFDLRKRVASSNTKRHRCRHLEIVYDVITPQWVGRFGRNLVA